MITEEDIQSAKLRKTFYLVMAVIFGLSLAMPTLFVIAGPIFGLWTLAELYLRYRDCCRIKAELVLLALDEKTQPADVIAPNLGKKAYAIARQEVSSGWYEYMFGKNSIGYADLLVAAIASLAVLAGVHVLLYNKLPEYMGWDIFVGIGLGALIGLICSFSLVRTFQLSVLLAIVALVITPYVPVDKDTYENILKPIWYFSCPFIYLIVIFVGVRETIIISRLQCVLTEKTSTTVGQINNMGGL